LSVVPHACAGGSALGPLRARPVRVEPGGGAAVVVAARPPSTRVRHPVPAAFRGPGCVPVAGGGQRDRAAAGAAGLPRPPGEPLRRAQGGGPPLRTDRPGPAARPAWPAQLAQARAGRGLPGRRNWTGGRATAEPEVGAGAGPQARLGPLLLVPAGARG